ncbi:PREDICTED: alcohol dehydrogenase 1-like [Papilio xuthus]|uniref:Alcohol dehydrogenase 1 n=1 Tax=Papilio xuthus TaxID=66420 RepID=I4DKW3_PAPXU|nr:alcohol dehydrogenase 1-like [Papilio xuthus]KPJ03685.1 Alcohol dehydrogenase 1 [Papilio xuthus]BAM18553.1 photoreceptor dehydrogenase [Papilio xuthus]
MARELQNKTIVITGGAMGIGYEIAENFLQKDPRVVIILDINEKFGAEAIKKLEVKYGKNKAVFYKCDVTTDLEVIFEKIIKEFTAVDVLVNNAGICNDNYLRKTIDVNVIALMEWSLKFWKHMRTDKSGKGGTIINIASIYGYRVDPYVPVYHASKFAVMGFTKSLGHIKNFANYGVRVVAICPGFTSDTNLGSGNVTFIPELMEEVKAFALRQVFQKPEAVGKAAVEVFEKADSGTAWLSEGGQPASLLQ